MTTAVAVSYPAELNSIGQSLADQARSLVIRDADSFALAGTVLRGIKEYLARVGEVLDPIVQAAFRAHKEAVTQKKRLEAPALEAEAIVKRSLATYEQEQVRLAREAAEAQRRERERLEAEARAAVDAEAARLTREAEDRRLADAISADERGDTALATKLLEAPIPVVATPASVVFVPPAPVQAPPKADGVSFRDEWDFEITDAALLPREYLVPDEKKIRGVVKSLRDATAIPGVRAFSRRVVAASRTGW